MDGQTTPTSRASGRPDALADAITAAALDALDAPDDAAARIVRTYAANVAAAIRRDLPAAVADALQPAG